MSTTIPNVSSIYRDLSHIYTSSNTLNRSDFQNTIGYSLEQRKDNGSNCFEDLYSYKQKRHNQLMSRLRNSSDEHKRLVGGLGDSSGFRQSSGYRDNSYNNNQYQQYSSVVPETRTSNVGTFTIPKIRYRHIEDQQKKNPNPNTNTNNINRSIQEQKTPTPQINQLQKQFYEDIGNRGTKYANQQEQPSNIKPNRQTVGIQAKTMNNFKNQMMGDDGRSQVSNRTNTFGKGNKNGKYEDKIQSYYQLCRKTVANKYPEPEKGKEKQEKFMRGNTGKNKAMKLDEAIKLLSSD